MFYWLLFIFSPANCNKKLKYTIGSNTLGWDWGTPQLRQGYPHGGTTKEQVLATHRAVHVLRSRKQNNKKIPAKKIFPVEVKLGITALLVQCSAY